jgi:hypothetical protein
MLPLSLRASPRARLSYGPLEASVRLESECDGRCFFIRVRLSAVSSATQAAGCLTTRNPGCYYVASYQGTMILEYFS